MLDKTFIKVTNQDIYRKLENIEKVVAKTKSQTIVNRVIGSTALTLVLAIIVRSVIGG